MTWSVVADSVAGTSHRECGLQCQDAFRFRIYGPGDDWLVIAVADGAGSAAFSEIGANLACEELVSRVEACQIIAPLDCPQSTALFKEVREVLFAEAKRLEAPSRELACTAILAIVGPETAAFAQIGDGAIVIGHGQGHRVVFWPTSGQYANMTNFLTDEEFAENIRIEAIIEPVLDLAVLSDGLQRTALNFKQQTAHPDFFGPLFEDVRGANDCRLLAEPFRVFLDSDIVNQRTDDDKTLVLAVRKQ